MRRGVYDSFRVQMLVNILGALLLLVASAAYILYSTIRIQEIENSSFERQRHLSDVQATLRDFQKPLVDYVSTKSSNALSELLVLSQRIKAMVPSYGHIPANPIDLRESEVYSLVSSYLDLAEKAIEEKRAVDVERYTSRYEEMRRLYGYIVQEIENISASRFSAQLAGYEEFIADSREIQFWNLLFSVFISLFSLFVIFRSVERINRPLVKLSATAAQIAAGNFEAEDVKTTSLYEIDRVVEAFNLMKRDIQVYIEEIKWQRNVEQDFMQERMKNMKMEAMIHRMELYTLQAQMNPHFLFNTLNTGVQLAIVEGAEKTSEYMEHLAMLFRHNIREKNVLVKLRHEVEGLEAYFYILGVRFPKSLDLSLDYPRDILDQYELPSYILQPLVENCVVHAFKGKEGRSSIVVRIYAEEGILYLSVADNGIGMSAEKVAALLSSAAANEPRSKVMGLENVIRRLRFFFPDEPEVIAIDSRADRGTEIRIRIDTEKETCIPS